MYDAVIILNNHNCSHTYSEHLSSFNSKISSISSSTDEEITQNQSMPTQNLVNSWSMTKFSSSTPTNEWNKLITHSKNLQDERGFPKILIFLASVPSCILISLIMGIMVNCLMKGLRNRRGRQRGSRLRNYER